MKKILSLVLALMLLVGCMSFAAAEEAITLNVWSFTNELEGMINTYYAPSHPNVTINYSIYPTDGGEYTSKVDAIMASAADSEEAPDIFTLEAAFVKKYVNSDVTADLIGELGITEEELAVAIPVMRQIGTSNVNGQLKGLSWQATPGALMYRASLAEKYLGVTSPEEMQALVADWDLFMETAAKVNEASEGATKMVVGAGDIWNAFNFGRTQGWVVDGKLVIDDVLYDYLDLAVALEEDDLSNKGAAWSEVWFQGMKTDSTFCFFLPTWGLHYTLKPNCGLTTNDTMTEEELKAACETDGGTYGDWRMIAGPVGYSWGGTWIGANAAKVNAASDAKKAAMKDFITFFTLSEEFLYAYAKDSGDFVGSNAVVEKILAEGGTPNPFLGGQDHYSIFAEAANLANGSIMTDYDEKMNSLWDTNVTTPYSKGEVDLDTAIANFKAEVAAQFPELIVE
ncbi:MAG: carbohydrate ABC transporter substrate-binding protein [Clostridiales bacterium]|nr:carbohydrate ABC transporter substrate-binding protein [Clostridiales bacterium]